MTVAIPALQRMHCEEVSTKWWLRRAACLEPATRFEWLAELDSAIDAHLDALLEGGALAPACAAEALDKSLRLRAEDAVADAFTVVALRCASEGAAGLLQCAADERLLPATRAYLAWSPEAAATQCVAQAVADPASVLHLAALRALHVHGLTGTDLGARLRQATVEDAPVVLEALGDCGAVDALGWVLQVMDNPQWPDTSPLRFAAAQCAALLGEAPRALPVLTACATSGLPHAAAACRLLALCLPAADLERLARSIHAGTANPPDPQLALRCLGWGGHLRHVPTVLDCLQQPPLAPVCEEAFLHMTGLRFEQVLEADAPADPLPAHALLRRWWEAHRSGFDHGTACLSGQPATPAHLEEVLLSGTQGARETAALRRLLALPGSLRFPTRAHVQRQWARMDAWQRPPVPSRDTSRAPSLERSPS